MYTKYKSILVHVCILQVYISTLLLVFSVYSASNSNDIISA